MSKFETLTMLIADMTAELPNNLGFFSAIDELRQCNHLETIVDCQRANAAIKNMHAITTDNQAFIRTEYSMPILLSIHECITVLTEEVEIQRKMIIVETIQEKIDNILRIIQDEFNKNGDKVYPDFFTSFSGVYLADSEQYFYLTREVIESNYKNKNFIVYSLDLAKEIQKKEVNQ